MSDQLSDAQNSGFDPYAHAAAKRAAREFREVAQVAVETDVFTRFVTPVAEAIAAAEKAIGLPTNSAAADHADLALAALSVLAPEIAHRDAALARLRDHLLAEADRLDREPWSPYRASESVARTLRKIVEETR
ncbi:MAG: hypothetical protein WBA97_34950 [Actinophytocola sp.]|uniref:hypothetical protein n=1 Tax=Actinophytocola sp. TaxID=1872138 RepID=UPI003C79436C